MGDRKRRLAAGQLAAGAEKEVGKGSVEGGMGGQRR